MTQRKGAVRLTDVSPDVLAQLNAGTLQTATLAEGLAIDLRVLLQHAVPDLAPGILDHIVPTDGITKRMATIGRSLAEQGGANIYERLAGHQSDTVRGWAAYVIAYTSGLSLPQRLASIRRLADDSHFGVREWSWLAFRPLIAADVPSSIEILRLWTEDASPGIRRFAVESTRPRGVWCAHITQLKQTPELGLPLLEPVKSDESRYVQDSVANWLNDAGKSQPAWVQSICRRWLNESSTPATSYICKRALRSIKE